MNTKRNEREQKVVAPQGVQSLDLCDAQHDPVHSPVSFMDMLHCVQRRAERTKIEEEISLLQTRSLVLAPLVIFLSLSIVFLGFCCSRGLMNILVWLLSIFLSG